MIIQYAVEIKNFNDESLFDEMIKRVSNDRIRKVEKYKCLEDKWRCLISEMLLRYALKEQYNILEKNICFSYNMYGKPKLSSYPHIHFNLSHSGKWVMCGIGNVPIGIDVEHMKNIDINISNRFFENKECEFIVSGENHINNFFTMWTLKESYIKARGRGLRIPLSSFYLELVDDEIFLYDEMGLNLNYCFSIGNVDDEYCNAICARCKDKNVIMKEIKKCW